jgi:hypothetical protein
MTWRGGMRDPLCRHDALLGLELDEVLLGDAGVDVALESRPHRDRQKFLIPKRRPTDTGWGAWYERELAAYRKRCEKKARRWNNKMRKLREQYAKTPSQSPGQSGLLRAHVPSLSAYVDDSVPDWWAMWSLLWVDVGWCMSIIGERGIATNRQELINKGVVTIYFTSRHRLPVCRTCSADAAFLIGQGGVGYGHLRPRCIPCWVKLSFGV